MLPELHQVKVPGQADLMFCRDQGTLGAQDLERVLKLSRLAYEASANNPQSSAHARFDITGVHFGAANWSESPLVA